MFFLNTNESKNELLQQINKTKIYKFALFPV